MTSPTETREAVARTIDPDVFHPGRGHPDDYFAPEVAGQTCAHRQDQALKLADAIIAAHLAPRDAEIESLRAERDELKTALDEMVATIDPTIDLIQRQRSWQAYGERLERDADAALADEIQTQRKRVVEMKAEVRTAVSERDAALSEVSRLTAGLAELERQGAVMRERAAKVAEGHQRCLEGNPLTSGESVARGIAEDIRALTLKEPTHEH